MWISHGKEHDYEEKEGHQLLQAELCPSRLKFLWGQGAARGPAPGAAGPGTCLGPLLWPRAVPLQWLLHSPAAQPRPLLAPDGQQGGQHLKASSPAPAAPPSPRRCHPGTADPGRTRRPSAFASTSHPHRQWQLTLEPFFLARLPGFLHAPGMHLQAATHNATAGHPPGSGGLHLLQC
jgi:hypothetical protein